MKQLMNAVCLYCALLKKYDAVLVSGHIAIINLHLRVCLK